MARADVAQVIARAAEAQWNRALRPALVELQAALAAGGSRVADALGALTGLESAKAAGAAEALDAAEAPEAAQASVAFVPAGALPPGEAYEAFIRRTGQVPTRDNLHDLFNGLQWWAQPALKARMNALQAAEIARAGIGARRGPLRDALTLMDENGALLEAPAPLWAALRARDWPGLFITHRALWREARLVIVGHALLDQLATAPRKPLTAHVLDAADPLALDEAGWAAKPFCPLPVLGVPGWWPANEAPAFYDDPSVFRPPRAATQRIPSVAAGAGPRPAAQAGRKPSIDR